MANPDDYDNPHALPICAISNLFEDTRQLTAVWTARTAAFLELGDRAEARREMLALLEWGNFWNSRDSLVATLVSLAVEGITQIQLEPLLMHPAWTAEDLASFDTSLARRDLLRNTFSACGGRHVG